MGLLDILTGGGLGAIAGAAGAIGGKIVELKLKDKELEAAQAGMAHELQMAPLRFQHELALRTADMQQTQLEAASKLQLAEVDADSKAAQGDVDLRIASFAADKATYGDHWSGRAVDFIRGITRPAVTWAAMALVIYTTHDVLQQIHAHPLPPEELSQHLGQMTFLASAAITWWFGARVSSPLSPRGKR